MRLAAFRAHGFKSFADAVSFKVGGELTGIVGPNGAGKSNIVDAVRWVLGESRASSLRSNILADVMFNGTEQRAPADWCEVEVQFDNPQTSDKNGSNNTSGSSNMWAAYPQITVRRQLSRDGRQTYMINDTTVRRRDVVDLFRGTGVAPRSYGVVEQGMVTDIAEASPEELRLFMEEAAGVSHYKDRRRDSERRLQASKDNLAQLALVQDGLTKQADGLKRQARTARRHRELGEEINHLNALLILSRRAAAERNLAASRQRLQQADAKANTLQAQLDASKQQAEEHRAARTAKQAELDAAVAAHAAAQQALTAAEHDMQNAAQGKTAAQQRWQDAQMELNALATQAQNLEAEEQALHKQQATLQTQTQASAGAAEEEAAELARLQLAREAAQTALDASREQLTSAEQALQSQTMRRQMQQERMNDIEKRLAEAAIAGEKLPLFEHTSKAEEALQAEEDALAAATQAREDARAKHAAATATAQEADAAVRQLENTLATIAAEINTLSAMLQEDGWGDGEQRLAHLLQVEAGDWARALDAALGVYATARAVDDLSAAVAAQMPPRGAAMVHLHPAAPAPQPSTPPLPPLLSKLQVPSQHRAALEYYLADVYAAEDDAAALAARAHLTPHQIIVTPAGAVVGAHSIYLAGEARGGYDWERRMKDLQQQQEQQQQKLAQKNAAHNHAQATATAAAAEVEQRTQQQASAQQTLAERRVEHSSQLEQQRAAHQRREELRQTQAELQEERGRLSAEQAELTQAQDDLKSAHTTSANTFEQDKQKLNAAAAALDSYREAAHEAGLARRDLQRQAEEVVRQQQELAQKKRDNAERQQLTRRRAAEFNQEVQRHDETALQQAHTAAQQRTAACEATATALRTALQEWEASAGKQEQAREATRTQLETLRQQAADERVQERELSLKADYESDALEELELSAEQQEAYAKEAEEGSAASRQSALDDLRQKRERLGAINFMADSELRECEAKLSEMQRQQSDVETAIAELHAAIRRIDEETQTRLQEMFDGVNREFSQLYKRIFDGGEARLEMLGDNILDVGFELKVRPPGKRLFPVRMLSGGEKAASATAFLFAILRLNPPPFCILDEVDAPLDDNRSQRFVDLLQDISASVQCLVVTHNKGTISNMPRLIGVTQEAPGVSKVVSVTLKDALQAAST